MKSKIIYFSCGALLLMGAIFNVEADEDGQRQEEPECSEILIKKRSVRPAYFRVERNDEGFAYKCTLRKKQNKKNNLEKFQRECESFVNDYIRYFDRCQDTDIPKIALDEPRDGQEQEDTEKFSIYRGQIEY